MSLHEQVPSVLTHGGDSRSAISSTLATAHAHHAEQSAVLGHMSQVAPEEDAAPKYPRVLHKPKGESKIVHSEDEHKEAAKDGWEDFPEEIKAEKATNGYSGASEPPFVLGNSPHPRHLHYDENEEKE